MAVAMAAGAMVGEVVGGGGLSVGVATAPVSHAAAEA